MFSIAAQSTWRRRGRLTGTVVAIVLGVGFLVGTMVLGDTFAASFDRLFTDTAAGTDVVVRNATSVSDEPDAQRGYIDTSIVDQIRSIDGVATAEPEITGYGQLLDADGEPLGGNGPPRIAGTWIEDPDLNPYELVEGRAPRTETEVVVNRGVADAGDLHVGDTTTVQTPAPVEVEIVGIATFGGEDGFGQTTYTGFSLAGAHRYISGSPDRISDILVAVDDGQTARAIRDRIDAALPTGVEAITGDDLVDERLDSLSFISIIRMVLVAFSLIALLVASVTISNTFTITTAQRTRELALLRAVGASRRQVRRQTQLEALTIGAVSAAIGVGVGVGLAVGLRAMFSAFGSGLPDGELTVTPVAVGLGLGAGVLVTLLASLGSARRASRISPVESLRSTAVEANPSKRRTTVGAATAVAGVIAVAVGLAGTTAFGIVGVIALLLGTLLLAPILLVQFVQPLRRLRRGFRHQLAYDNVIRQPRRSASAATALVIGVAVVSLCTVLAASLKTQIESDVVDGFGDVDLAISTPVFGGGGLDPSIVPDITAIDGVDTVAGIDQTPILVDGDQTTATATDLATLEAQGVITILSGDATGAGEDGVAIDETTADDRGLDIGSTIEMGFVDGATEHLTVSAIIEDHPVLSGTVIPSPTWIAHQPQPAFDSAFLTLGDGVDVDSVRQDLEPLADRFSGSVQDRTEFAAAQSAGLDLLLTVVYVMLDLSIVISLLGIANTLTLAVHERRREIGLLRAVGQTRRQVRASLRSESVVLALFGTLLGAVVGTLGGAVVHRVAFDGDSTTIPTVSLVVIAVLGTIAGSIAARRPSRRAARLPVLDALGDPT